MKQQRNSSKVNRAALSRFDAGLDRFFKCALPAGAIVLTLAYFGVAFPMMLREEVGESWILVSAVAMGLVVGWAWYVFKTMDALDVSETKTLGAPDVVQGRADMAAHEKSNSESLSAEAADVMAKDAIDKAARRPS